MYQPQSITNESDALRKQWLILIWKRYFFRTEDKAWNSSHCDTENTEKLWKFSGFTHHTTLRVCIIAQGADMKVFKGCKGIESVPVQPVISRAGLTTLGDVDFLNY